MATLTEPAKSSWADEIEEETTGGGKKSLPPSTEVVENNNRYITTYRYNEDDNIEKVVRVYKIERRLVSKAMAIRKNWKKFGESEDDKPGPNSKTTLVSEEIQMQFITNKDDADKPEETALDKLKSEKSMVKCRTCNGDHWTLCCPYKDTMSKLAPQEKANAAAGGVGGDDKSKPQASKYVAPSLREGATAKRGDSSNPRYDALAIRITNLSANTTDHDLQELIKPFGPISKLYLAKDKFTGASKGFAYIHFKNKMDAQAAITKLNGYGYDHLILSVDWSKQS